MVCQRAMVALALERLLHLLLRCEKIGPETFEEGHLTQEIDGNAYGDIATKIFK